MKLFYCDQFVLPLPPEHRFPMQKYVLLRARAAASGRFEATDFVVPAAISRDLLEEVHDPDYVVRACAGQLTNDEQRAIGFPWSAELIERSRRSAGATLAAAQTALVEGAAVNLAGGTHHAFRDRGEGYCVFNDSVLAARGLQRAGLVERIAIIDCDVHQGNGTASLCAGDASLFTFSIHGAYNYPLRKQQSNLDVPLPDATGDEAYLAALADGLAAVALRFDPQLVIYVSGADPFVGDRLGRMALTKTGLAARDRLVFEYCQQMQVPVAVSMAGGYARQVEDIVDIHFQTVAQADDYHRQWVGRTAFV